MLISTASVALGVAALVTGFDRERAGTAAPGVRPPARATGAALLLEEPAPLPRPDDGGSDASRRVEAPLGELPERRADLLLRFYDRETGLPVVSRIDFWRLDLPEDETWTAGDVRRFTGREVPKAGLLLEDLPVGRYRAMSHTQRDEAEDPPDFSVCEPRTEEALALDLPRVFQVHLELYGAHGERIEEARIGESRSSRTVGRPKWVQLRRRKDPSVIVLGCGGGNGFFTTAGNETAGPDGFDLGLRREMARGAPLMGAVSVHPVPLTPARLALDRVEPEWSAQHATAETRTYVAVCLPQLFFEDSIFLPDGRRAFDAGARPTISCNALLRRPDSPPDLWLYAPVDVLIGCEGHEDLRFRYRLADGPVRREMRKK